MSPLQYTLVGTDDGSNITVFVEGEVKVAHSSHPNFEKIVAGVLAKDESVIDLFDVAATAASKFARLTERVTEANGFLFLDGVEVRNALADQVVRFLSEGVEDWKPLVAFFENVQSNPNEHSREQLYDWLDAHEFTITEDGLIVGYKGVNKQDDGTFLSGFSGKAIVNGEVVNGYIPNAIGSIVEMPRDEVAHDPSTACSTGLHVGTYSYAQAYARGAMLEVHVNPRDVVSVPTDASGEKVRVCRYTVINTIDAPHSVAVVWSEEDFEDESKWGDGEAWRETEDDGHNHDLRLSDTLEDTDEAEVPTLEDGPVVAVEGYGTVAVGDVFETTDKRRAGTTFKVESIEGDEAVGKSMPKNLTRKVALDRLTSYRYRKV